MAAEEEEAEEVEAVYRAQWAAEGAAWAGEDRPAFRATGGEASSSNSSSSRATEPWGAWQGLVSVYLPGCPRQYLPGYPRPHATPYRPEPAKHHVWHGSEPLFQHSPSIASGRPAHSSPLPPTLQVSTCLQAPMGMAWRTAGTPA